MISEYIRYEYGVIIIFFIQVHLSILFWDLKDTFDFKVLLCSFWVQPPLSI